MKNKDQPGSILHEAPASAINDRLLYRYHESPDRSLPTLVYLPGVHGDWSPQDAARPYFCSGSHFVEVAYPRVADWPIERFADALAEMIAELKLGRVHLACESFGSLVGWAFVLRHPELARSIHIVGGFTHSPAPLRALMARTGLLLLPSPIFELGIESYIRLREAQGVKRDPDSRFEGHYYFAPRSKAGRLATAHRLDLICKTDFRPVLSKLALPVRYIGGGSDWTVPTHREVKTLEKQLRPECDFQSKLIARAPHMIVCSHPQSVSTFIIESMAGIEDAWTA